MIDYPVLEFLVICLFVLAFLFANPISRCWFLRHKWSEPTHGIRMGSCPTPVYGRYCLRCRITHVIRYER